MSAEREIARGEMKDVGRFCEAERVALEESYVNKLGFLVGLVFVLGLSAFAYFLYQAFHRGFLLESGTPFYWAFFNIIFVSADWILQIRRTALQNFNKDLSRPDGQEFKKKGLRTFVSEHYPLVAIVLLNVFWLGILLGMKFPAILKWYFIW